MCMWFRMHLPRRAERHEDGTKMKSFNDITSEYYSRTKGAKHRAAGFLLLNRAEAAFLTLEEVAARAGVSPATVTRCVAEMGYESYHEMLKDLREAVRQAMPPMERLNERLGTGYASGFDESVKNDCDNIGKMMSLNGPDAVKSAVDALADAARIRLFASRTSYGAMSFFAFALAQTRPDVALMSEAEGRLTEYLLDASPDDLYFVADLPRYARTSLFCAEHARRRGCKVLALTDSPSSPLARCADISLFVPFESHSFFNSSVAALTMYNGLATALNLKLKDSSLERLRSHNALLREMDLLVL